MDGGQSGFGTAVDARRWVCFRLEAVHYRCPPLANAVVLCAVCMYSSHLFVLALFGVCAQRDGRRIDVHNLVADFDGGLMT